MNLAQLSKSLTSVFNTVGNKWLEENFGEGPFDFRVYVRKGGHDETANYVAEVYSEPPIPKGMNWKDPSQHNTHGIHYSVFENKLKELSNYVDVFGGLGKILKIKLMDVIYVKPKKS